LISDPEFFKFTFFHFRHDFLLQICIIFNWLQDITFGETLPEYRQSRNETLKAPWHEQRHFYYHHDFYEQTPAMKISIKQKNRTWLFMPIAP
jgi:hypothetical protein